MGSWWLWVGSGGCHSGGQVFNCSGHEWIWVVVGQELRGWVWVVTYLRRGSGGLDELSWWWVVGLVVNCRGRVFGRAVVVVGHGFGGHLWWWWRARMSRTTGSGQQVQISLRCLSCKEEYCTSDAGTCKECYEEASETEEELKREIEDLKSKVAFLRLTSSPLDSHKRSSSLGFTDVVLVATDEFHSNPLSLPAHKAVLVSTLFLLSNFILQFYTGLCHGTIVESRDGQNSSYCFDRHSRFYDCCLPGFHYHFASRSPVFKAMLEIEMEESRSGTINISDVSYDALRAFINYLYTAEASLDEQMACDLLVLAEKYEVKHLKTYCEKFLVSKLNWDNSIASFSFAHQHHAKHLLESALSMIIDNMDNLTKSEEYAHLVEKDPKLVVEIYEAYMSKQVNTAARTN
ncbi:hypothetical protein RDABS01_009934 [Bienertia sinuspersici]